MKMIKTFRNSKSSQRLVKLLWNHDIERSKIAIKALKTWKISLNNIKEVSLIGSISSKKMRDHMRKYFDNVDKKLLLTQKQIDGEDDDSVSDESDDAPVISVSDITSNMS